MSHLKVHEQYRTMTCSEVAADLRRLATQLESGGCVSNGGGSIAVPPHVERELEIGETVDGAALSLEFKLKWAAGQVDSE